MWIKDPESIWIAARVTEDFKGSSLTLEIEDDANSLVLEIGSQKGQHELPPLRNPDILIGENDLTSLSYLHEVSNSKLSQNCVKTVSKLNLT